MTSPWKSSEIKETTSETISLEFEDNFEPNPVEFNKLPDSNEYLLSLGKLLFFKTNVKMASLIFFRLPFLTQKTN